VTPESSPVTEGEPLKIDIDVDRCNGHGQCEMFAPTVFELDDYGCITQKNEVDDSDPVEVEAVRTAAERCPERVITLVDLD